jgi:ribosomal protein S6--L-glutamate ligase
MEIALRCGFDHVALDLCEDRGRFLVLEANMVFGEEGFSAAGLHYREILKEMVDTGEI